MSDDRIRTAIKHAFERRHELPAPGFADRVRSVRLDDGAREWHVRVAAVVALMLAVGMIAGLLLSNVGLPSRPAGAPSHPTPVPRTSPALPSPSPSPRPLQGTLRMVDGWQGWLFTSTRAYRTTDAGANWTDVGPIPDAGSEPVVTVRGVDMAWLVVPTQQGSGDVYRTTDGGASWARIGSVGGGIGQLTFVDSQHGWLLGRQNGASNHEWVVLYGTSDGGRTWQELAQTAPSFQAPGPGQLSSSCDKTGMTFLDALHGWITEYCMQATSPFFYRTSDGGRTWYQQQLSGIQTHQEIGLSPVVFLDRSFGVFTVSQGANTLTLYSTSDGGATWNVAAQVPGCGNLRPILISPHQWIVPCGPNEFTVVTNGRATAVPADFGPQGMEQLWFGDEFHGLAITNDGRFLRTDDGGHTWLPVNVQQ